MKKTIMKKNAFTMLELVFAIVVIGILAALAIPRLDRDLRQGAKDNLLSAIRHTQDLALVDNKTNPTDTDWQKKLWQIRFSLATDNLATFYTISSDVDGDGSVDKNETAIDPVNGKYMYNFGGDTTIDDDESPNIFIGKKYGIKNTTSFSGGCENAQHIAFDHLGRPYNGIGSATNTYDKYMTEDCIITFTFISDDIADLNITIATETGYVSGN